MQPAIMTRQEVAALLKCSAPHVAKLVATRGLPGFRLGAREVETISPRKTIMTQEEAWDALMRWGEDYDDRKVSDAARRWSNTETRIIGLPDTIGAWAASMEAAFDAGRLWERLGGAL